MKHRGEPNGPDLRFWRGTSYGVLFGCAAWVALALIVVLIVVLN